MQKSIEAQTPRAFFKIENVRLHSNNATAMAVVIGR